MGQIVFLVVALRGLRVSWRWKNTDLSDTYPESGLLDIGGGFVVAAQESDGHASIAGWCFGGPAELGEDGLNVVRVGNSGWVGGRPDDDEVVAEGVVAG